MTAAKRTELTTRDTILKLLSDDEVAKVSSAEGSSQLADGAEYIDLEQPIQGVKVAAASAKMDMGHVLPRSAVSDATWHKIKTHLAV